MDCRDDIDALEALRLHIDQELLDLSFLSDGGSSGRRELRKTSSVPDLRNLHITITDMETSSVCTVDDLSQGSPAAVRTRNSAFHRDSNTKNNLKHSKEWLDTFL